MAEFVEYREGTGLPLIICVPHDGKETPEEINDRENGGIADSMTLDIGEGLYAGLTERFGKSPHLVISKLHRSKLDPNREIKEAAEGDPLAEKAYNIYHDYIRDARTTLGEAGPGLILDIHGQAHGYNMTELGYLIWKDNLNSGNYKPEDTSIRGLVERTGKDLTELLHGPESLGGLLTSAGYKSVPSHKKPAPGSQKYFRGGYTVQTHGSKDGGQVDAIQIEVQSEIRVQKDGGGKKKRDPFTKALVDVVADFLTMYYNVQE